MTENKMTEAEIMKEIKSVLRLAKYVESDYVTSPLKTNVLFGVLDLINSKNAEIERLREHTVIFMPARSQGKTRFLVKKYNAVRAEAIKEFAERVKERASQGFWETDSYIGMEQIDQIAKEMGVEL